MATHAYIDYLNSRFMKTYFYVCISERNALHALRQFKSFQIYLSRYIHSVRRLYACNIILHGISFALVNALPDQEGLRIISLKC